MVIDKIRDVLEPERAAKEKELNHYNASIGGMIEDIPDYEDGLREDFRYMVDERANIGAIVKDLKKLIKKHENKQ